MGMLEEVYELALVWLLVKEGSIGITKTQIKIRIALSVKEETTKERGVSVKVGFLGREGSLFCRGNTPLPSRLP
jgi:hypothetical protein